MELYTNVFVRECVKLRELVEEKYGVLMDIPNRENNKIAYVLLRLLDESKK